MTGYPYRTLFAWIAALALIWLTLCSPWPSGWNLLAGAAVILAALVAIAVATRRIRARREATQHMLHAIDDALGALPGDVKRNTPMVLTVGDPASTLVHAFGDDLVHITDAAIWLRVDEPTRLMHLADALKRWREGQGPDAIMVLIGADGATDAATLAAGLKRWRSAIGEASRAVGYALPVCVAVYTEEAYASIDDSPWFGISSSERLRLDTLASLVASRVTQYARMAIPAHRASRAQRAAKLDALARWACDAVLPSLVDESRGSQPARLTGFGVTATEGSPAPDSLYARFVSTATGLQLTSTDGIRVGYALPEPLIRGITPQTAQPVLPRALAHAFVWLGVCFCAAAAASAWQNRALVQRVTDHMARYRAISPTQDAARIDALNAVKRDRDELDRYARSGVPPRLGLGFYRGAALLPVANALIASYEPPPAAPSTVELDSLALFRSGSATLNRGSNRALVDVLALIKAHPNKRVLVAGHTDSVGSARGNLQLSEARAASVRDWLADASGIPLPRFAIQGYGDTRPKASNDTEAGRAANRRVEITLVPDCRDDSSTQGHPACSFK